VKLLTTELFRIPFNIVFEEIVTEQVMSSIHEHVLWVIEWNDNRQIKMLIKNGIKVNIGKSEWLI
jgi:hypothetical protein